MKNPYDNDAKADLAVNGAIDRKYLFDDGRQMIIKASLGDGHLDIRDLRTGGPFQIEDPAKPGGKTAMDALTLERVISENRLVSLHPVAAGVFGPELDDDAAAEADPRAAMKQAIVRELAVRGVGASHPGLSRHFTDIWTKNGYEAQFGARPATKTARAWLGKDDPTTISIAQLMSQSGKVPRASRLKPEVAELVETSAEHFYDKRGHRLRDSYSHLSTAHSALKRSNSAFANSPCPSRETLRRRIGELLTPERYEKKYGKAAREKNFGGAGLGLAALRIGELGVMDDTWLDAVACFDGERGLPAGRPNLCIIVDVASRCIVGYLLSFSPPTACTAIEAIKAANGYNRVPQELLSRYPVLERINCLFSEIVVDRGSNYTSRAFGQALLDFGTALRFARVRRAKDKGLVERIFDTFKTFLVEKLPGATFDPKLLREFDYDPQVEAVLTIAELIELIDHFIAVYHITVHTGIGVQPALFWSKSLTAHGRRLMTDTANFGILAGETIVGVQMHRWGFTINGIRYTHPVNVDVANTALAGAQAVGTIDDFTGTAGSTERRSKGRRRKSRSAGLGNTGVTSNFKAKRNQANIGTVHGWIPGHGWLPFTAANFAYADGLSLYQHERIGEWAKARNMKFSTEEEQLAARAALIERVAELAPDMNLRDRRAVARMVEHEPSADAMPGATPASDPDVIAVDPCDERIEPEPSPAKRPGGRGGKGKSASAPTVDPAAEMRAQLAELAGLDWDTPVPDDERMEEFA